MFAWSKFFSRGPGGQQLTLRRNHGLQTLQKYARHVYVRRKKSSLSKNFFSFSDLSGSSHMYLRAVRQNPSCF